MQKTAPSTLSADGTLCLACPRAWSEMTQQQLRFALTMMGSGQYGSDELKTLLFVRMTGIRVHSRQRDGWNCSVRVPAHGLLGRKTTRWKFFFLQAWQIQDFLKQLDYVDSYETMNVRLESIQGCRAVDLRLHGVRFHDYLQMEKNYQGYLHTHQQAYVLGLARLLYTTPEGEHARFDRLGVAETMGTVMWYAYIKKQLALFFPHFFRPVPQTAAGTTTTPAVNWLDQMNAQMRALTDGDITKEHAVYNCDCWRALTELDAKAREAEELRRRTAK